MANKFDKVREGPVGRTRDGHWRHRALCSNCCELFLICLMWLKSVIYGFWELFGANFFWKYFVRMKNGCNFAIAFGDERIFRKASEHCNRCLFSSVGQSTWFVISGSLVRIRQEALKYWNQGMRASARLQNKGEYQSGQMGQTVNLLVYTFGGSNPSSPTNKMRK